MINYLQPDTITLADITTISYESIGFWLFVIYQLVCLISLIRHLFNLDYLYVNLKLVESISSSAAVNKKFSLKNDIADLGEKIKINLCFLVLGFFVPLAWIFFVPVFLWYPVRKFNEERAKKDRVMDILRGE